MKTGRNCLEKLKDISKPARNVFKIFSFSYTFIGIFYLLFGYIYAFVKGYNPTFRIWVAFILEVPFWALVPNVRVAGALVMIILSLALLKFKALNYKKFEIIATIFQILLFVSVAVYFGTLTLPILGNKSTEHEVLHAVFTNCTLVR